MAKKEKKEKKEKKVKIKKIKVKKTSWYWIYFVIGGICILLSLFFAPFWFEIKNKSGECAIPWGPWHKYALGIMLAVAIFAYIFIILLKRIKQKDQHKVVRIIMAIEFSLLVVLAVACVVKSILYNNEKFRFLNSLEILAIIMWVRGFVEIIDAYYYDRNSGQKYPIWFLLINVLLISVGPILLVIGIRNNDKIDTIVSYVFCSILLFFGVFLCCIGGLSKPIKIIEEPANNDPVDSNLESQKENEYNEKQIALEDEKEVSQIEENKPAITLQENEVIDISEEEPKE